MRRYLRETFHLPATRLCRRRRTVPASSRERFNRRPLKLGSEGEAILRGNIWSGDRMSPSWKRFNASVLDIVSLKFLKPDMEKERGNATRRRTARYVSAERRRCPQSPRPGTTGTGCAKRTPRCVTVNALRPEVGETAFRNAYPPLENVSDHSSRLHMVPLLALLVARRRRLPDGELPIRQLPPYCLSLTHPVIRVELQKDLEQSMCASRVVQRVAIAGLVRSAGQSRESSMRGCPACR